MKRKYLAPALKIEKFIVENIMTESATDVLKSSTITDKEMAGVIKFDDGNTLQSIDYTKFFK